MGRAATSLSTLGSVFNYRFWSELRLYLSLQQGELRSIGVVFFSSFLSFILFGIAAKKLRRGFPTSVGRAFALLMLRLSGFFSLPILLSRRIRDYEASGYEGGGLSPSLCLM